MQVVKMYGEVEKGVVVMGRSRWVTGLSGLLAAGLLAAGVSVVPGGVAFAAADPGMSIAPMPVTPVSLAQAGELVQWRSNSPNDDPELLGEVPASLSGVAVTQVALAGTVGFAVTAAGRLVSWGSNTARLERIPAEVASAEVVQVATSDNYAGVVTRSGEVKVWGIKRNFATPLTVPAGLSGVKQLALNNAYALALRQDGSVVGWGSGALGEAREPGEPPAGLPPLAAISMDSTAYGLTTAGTVVGWNSQGRVTLPAEVRAELEQPGNVKSVATQNTDGIAVLQSGEVVTWGGDAPATATATPAAALVSSGRWMAVVDTDGVIHHWLRAAPPAESGFVPAGLNGRALSYLALSPSGHGAAIVTKLLRAADPRIAGSAVVGQTLTATPGTFSASPSVSSQWLANGTPIAGASGTTLPVTAALLGKSITYQSTATKSGEASVTSTSAAVTVTNAPPPPASGAVASSTKVVSVKVAKKAKQVAVAGKVTASKPVTGKAKVTIKKGKKVMVAKTVQVTASGAVKLTVKKFGSLVIKKTKPKKGKKGPKATYRGKYVVTIAYAGNAQVKPSTGTKAFVIKK